MSKLDELMALAYALGYSMSNPDDEATLNRVRTALQDALKAVVEDAERYRWLRAQVTGHRAVSSARPATFAFPGPMALPPIGDIMRGSVAQHLDAAIDAARKP